MKKYQSPKIELCAFCAEDMLTNSYGERFGVVFSWDGENGNGEE